MQTSAEPSKIYIVRKVLMRAIHKCDFYRIRATVSKVMGIYVKFYHDHSLNMVMHVTLPATFENFYSSPTSILILGKVTTFGGNWLKNKKLQAKRKSWGGTPPPPVLIGLKQLIMSLRAVCRAVARFLYLRGGLQ